MFFRRPQAHVDANLGNQAESGRFIAEARPKRQAVEESIECRERVIAASTFVSTTMLVDGTLKASSGLGSTIVFTIPAALDCPKF